MSIQQSVEDSRSGLERLMSHLPGYGGYKEKENRRAADKLLRDHLCSQLDAQQRRLAELQRQLIESGGLALIDDLERAVNKVQKLADKIRTASYGYAGLFDAVTVKEEELDALYQFDEGMLSHIAAIESAVDDLAAAMESEGDVKAAINNVVAVSEEANAGWRRREEAVIGAV